MILITQQLY